MRNKYQGTCFRCGGVVEPGKGHFQKVSAGWLVQHAECAIKWRGTKHHYKVHERKTNDPRNK